MERGVRGGQSGIKCENDLKAGADIAEPCQIGCELSIGWTSIGSYIFLLIKLRV